MSPEDRRRLIERPIVFNIVERKTHAGMLIERELPTQGRRRPCSFLENDESYGGLFTATDLEDLIGDMED
jgi:hypothetical protein